METDVVVKGNRIRLSRDAVVAAVANVEPGRIQKHVVDVAGTEYPVKQAFSLATGRDVLEFDTTQARNALARVGLTVRRVG